MRICIDLDGVICGLKGPQQTYADVQPLPGAVAKLKRLKENGHCIIIFTARHMKTCNGNVHKVLARIGKITLEWLDRHQIAYDEIVFGKPWADVYIDDNAFRFDAWDQIADDGADLPTSHEKRTGRL